jgi:hypothetical protein
MSKTNRQTLIRRGVRQRHMGGGVRSGKSTTAAGLNDDA